MFDLARFRRLAAARTNQKMDALDVELFTTTKQLLEYDLANKTSASREKDACSLRVSAHVAT